MENGYRSQTYYEHSMDSVLTMLADGTITDANPAACEIFDLSKTELCAISYNQIAGKNGTNAEQLFKRTLQAGNITTRLTFTRKNGTDLIADVKSVALGNASGNNSEVMLIIRDITANVSAQNKVKETEDRYKQIVELAKEGIWVVDEDSNTVFANDSLCEILEYSKEEIQGKNVFFFMDEEGREIAEKNIERRKNGITEQHDFTFRTKSGNAIWTIVNTSPVWKNGNYAGAIAVITDVTSRKLIETALHEREERFRVMVENSYDSILLLNEDLLTVYRSPSTSHIMGFKDDERLGNSYLELAHPDDVDKMKMLQQAVLQNPGKSIPITLRARHTDGHYLWFIGVATNLLHEPGVGAIVVNLRDITERKQAEDELMRLSNRLQLATKAANVCIWDWNIIEDKLSWDERMYTLYNLEPEQFEHTYAAWMMAIHADDRERVMSEIQGSINGNGDLDTKFRIVLPAGELRYVQSMSIIERDSAGNAIRMVGTDWDITGHIHAAREKEKIVAELIERNKALEQFAYIISHNLRAPVANVISLTDMIIDEDFDEEVRPAVLSGLSLSVKKIDQIITDLNYIFQSKQLLNDHREDVDLKLLINDIKFSINDLIVKETVTLRCNFEGAALLFTTRLYLYSILFNLILNAIKYRKPAVAPVIDISSTINDEIFEITIADNGRGIDMKRNGDMLFGLYQRFDPSVEGRGIGLHMVKTQTDALGGKIEVKSILGEGTEFKIKIPLNT
jgi:PAS domain S-box-containing protein